LVSYRDIIRAQQLLLNKAVNYFRWHYYYDDPIISDYEFDELLKSLQALEAKHLYLKPTVSAEVAPSREPIPDYPL